MDEHKKISSKGGKSTLKRHGLKHFSKIARKRWLKEKLKPRKRKNKRSIIIKDK